MSVLAASARRIRLLLFVFVREAVAGPLGPGTLQTPVSLGCSPADATDDDGGRAVCQEDVCVVFRLLGVAEQEAVAGAQRIERGLRGRAALGLHFCKGRKKKVLENKVFEVVTAPKIQTDRWEWADMEIKPLQRTALHLIKTTVPPTGVIQPAYSKWWVWQCPSLTWCRVGLGVGSRHTMVAHVWLSLRRLETGEKSKT